MWWLYVGLCTHMHIWSHLFSASATRMHVDLDWLHKIGNELVLWAVWNPQVMRNIRCCCICIETQREGDNTRGGGGGYTVFWRRKCTLGNFTGWWQGHPSMWRHYQEPPHAFSKRHMIKSLQEWSRCLMPGKCLVIAWESPQCVLVIKNALGPINHLTLDAWRMCQCVLPITQQESMLKRCILMSN